MSISHSVSSDSVELANETQELGFSHNQNEEESGGSVQDDDTPSDRAQMVALASVVQ